MEGSPTRSINGDGNAIMNASLLRPRPVEQGELCRRVICTKKFITQMCATLIVCAGLHVLSGWLTYTGYGKHPFPAANDTSADACIVGMKGPQPAYKINLVPEIFGDALLTAFFASGAQLPQRIKDVTAGRLPLVQSEAFPGGCPYSCLFPPCRKSGGVPASRHDHTRNLASWFGLALSWGIGWGALTVLVLEVLLKLNCLGHEHECVRCFSPWEYIAMRAFWTDLEALMVVGGSYILWSTRGEGTSDEQQTERATFASFSPPLSTTTSGLTAVKPLASLREPLHRDQLASPTASNFVSVD